MNELSNIHTGSKLSKQVK